MEQSWVISPLPIKIQDKYVCPFCENEVIGNSDKAYCKVCNKWFKRQSSVEFKRFLKSIDNICEKG